MINTAKDKFFVPILFGLAFLICLTTVARAATFTVTSDGDSGAGTLREAITQANASAGVADTINFNIAGGGVRTINLLSPLPAITGTGSLRINGYTQPGASVNTLPNGSNAVLTVELNGAGAGAAIGLRCSVTGGAFCEIGGLVINRFQEGGIRIDSTAVGVVLGNFIGTNAAGTAASGNFNYGVLILDGTGAGTSVGDGTIGGRNVISGNSGNGITIANPAVSNSVIFNLIGTDKAGTADVGNSNHGILISNAGNNQISENVISGNNGNGVAILRDFGFTPAGNSVLQNFIGVDAGGNAVLGNNGSGVLVQSENNIIGGANAGNVISGNGANGVSLGTNFAVGNTVRANYIGVGANGTTAIANVNNGVQISNGAAGNTVGGTTGITAGSCAGACNIIANNGTPLSASARAGIYLDATAGAGNAIRANSIFNNLGTGIDLGAPGANANDAGDADTGPNNLQNKPVITGANDLEFISGTLNSTPSTVFAIDFFVNPASDTMSGSEGRAYIGTVSTTTDGTGNANFTFTTSVPLAVGQFVTATATATGSAFAPQAVGDSSEHSDAVAVINQPTSATVEISGRVLSGKGRGVSRAIVSLTDSNGATLRTRTNAFGYYRFTEIPAGETYTISVNHRIYQFTPQIVAVNEALENLDFMALP